MTIGKVYPMILSSQPTKKVLWRKCKYFQSLNVSVLIDDRTQTHYDLFYPEVLDMKGDDAEISINDSGDVRKVRIPALIKTWKKQQRKIWLYQVDEGVYEVYFSKKRMYEVHPTCKGTF